MLLQETHRRLLDERARQGRHDSDKKLTLFLPADGLDGVLHLADTCKDAINFLIEPHAALCRRKSSFDAIEQAEPRVFLEMSDKFAHRGLRDVEDQSGTAD